MRTRAAAGAEPSAGSGTPAPRRQRELHRDLLPLAPLLYLAWADGALSAEELEAVRDVAGRPDLLDAHARTVLRAWLNPDDPPSAAELERLLELIEAYGGHDMAAGPEDLVRLGERIAATAQTDTGDAVRTALEELQQALGVASVEAARSLTDTPPPAPPDVAGIRHTPALAFDPARLNEWLDSDSRDTRARVMQVLTTDSFHFVDPRDTRAYRETVLAWCRVLADEGFGALAFPEEFGGRNDVAASIAAFETIAYHDLSLLVKYGVHFGLFGGSIFLLGTRRHHEKYLRDVASLELPGCFAMTETGHGSNVRDIETTARYDSATGEFVIHTPSLHARKDYIGNAALHGRLAVVFAQLHTDTGDHGVHAFLVPIRDGDGNVLAGVSIEDCGLKAGLNGVDNGRIAFDQVRIPRDNLLDRYGSVSEGGAYASPIPGAGRRFFTMLGTLVAGRISIACASLSAAKNGLTIAVRYTDQRRQFGPEGGAEVPVLDYITMQRRLIPRLATAIALDFALKSLVRSFATRSDEDTREIETLAAALKAFASDWTVDTLQECREACGGQGYLASNRIGALRADTDVFTTFEGANHVLYQLVARGCLTEYRDQFGELKLWNIARHIAARAATRVTELNPITTRRTDTEHLVDTDFHAAAFRYREERLTASLARRLKQRIDDGMDSFDALNECQDHAVALGRAFAERFILERLHAGVADCPDPASARVLERLSALFGLARLEAGADWYLETGYIDAPKSRAIRSAINDLCRELRPVAPAVAAAFGIPDRLLEPPPAHLV
ncbi:MAG TPA: acyl-CoA dehydrogenase [Longimicrobiales bacterium]|nr:acyl-CoA dehydrogenase [Longimicrobiales bacterium]